MRQTFAVLEYARSNRCRTRAIPDSPISPVGQAEDGVLLVGNQSSTYFNSLAGAVTLVNCLVVGVSGRNWHSLETLNRVNQLVTKWKYLRV